MSPKAARGYVRGAVRRAEPAAVDLPDDDTEDGAGMGALSDDVEATEELAELSAQLPEDASLSLYRRLDGAEKEFCDQMAVKDFSVATVAARFGGGRYTIYLRKPDPDRAGKWIRQGSKQFRIAGTPRTGTDVPAVVAGQPSGMGEAEKVLRTYGDLIQSTVKSSLENQNLLQQMQLAVVSRLAERPPDTTMELLKVLLPLLVSGRGEGHSLADVLSLADRVANKASAASQLKETLALIETARQLGGGEAPAPAWLGVARSAVDVIGRALTYNPRRVPAADVVVSEGTPPPAPDAAPVADGVDVHPLLTFLGPQIPALVQHAEQDHDPDTYAGVICDQISVQHAPDVITFLQSPTFMVQLTAAYPAVVPWSVWFAELRDDVITRLQELLQPAAPDATAESP